MSEPVVVALAGEIDLAVRDEVLALVDEGVQRALAARADLHLDMAAVTFIDSSGLSCIARAVLAMQADGQQVWLRNVDARTLGVLELVGMHDLVLPT